MTAKKNYPHWAYPTHRAFKARKRRDLREVARALKELRYGCAYLPSGDHHVYAILRAVDALKEEMSTKRWGR